MVWLKISEFAVVALFVINIHLLCGFHFIPTPKYQFCLQSHVRNKRFDGKSHAITVARTCKMLRGELQEIFHGNKIKSKSKPPLFLLRFISIEEVHVNDDFSSADAFIQCFGNAMEKRVVYLWICRHVKEIQHWLACRFRHLRRVPQVTFHLIDDRDQQFLQEAQLEKISTVENFPWKKVEFHELIT